MITRRRPRRPRQHCSTCPLFPLLVSADNNNPAGPLLQSILMIWPSVRASWLRSSSTGPGSGCPSFTWISGFLRRARFLLGELAQAHLGSLNFPCPCPQSAPHFPGSLVSGRILELPLRDFHRGGILEVAQDQRTKTREAAAPPAPKSNSTRFNDQDAGRSRSGRGGESGRGGSERERQGRCC